eukprot:1331558-Amphidinium_carterae.1
MEQRRHKNVQKPHKDRLFTSEAVPTTHAARLDREIVSDQGSCLSQHNCTPSTNSAQHTSTKLLQSLMVSLLLAMGEGFENVSA